MTAASHLAQNKPAENAISALAALISTDMKAVNALILERMDSEVPLIPKMANYLIAAGGKRLRPMLTLASAQLCEYQGQRHQKLACCVEFIHSATLLHDDVVDESSLRRGQTSANEIWGNQASVLVGDFLFSRAFELMVSDGSLDVLAILSKASATIAEGEVAQLTTANDLNTSQEHYFRVIRAKTAALFAAACEIGAVITDQPKARKEALHGYGEKLGIAFQLVDDALDYSAKQEKLGKTIGDDFREGKVTLPVVLAYKQAGPQERTFWKRCVENLDQEEGDLQKALAYLHQHESLTKTLTLAQDMATQAKANLSVFPPGPIRQALFNIADFCVQRSY